MAGFGLRSGSDRHRLEFCLNGQGLLPYEQYTQQSSGFGFSIVPQFGHSAKYTQRSVGIVSAQREEQDGHVIVTLKSGNG
jgi:hypothetical protein